jgi:hypothetical protein
MTPSRTVHTCAKRALKVVPVAFARAEYVPRAMTRLAWRELQRYIAKYPQLELTRASEIAKYLRELAVGPRGKDNVRDAIVQLFRFARRHGYLGEDRISEAERSGKLSPGMMLDLDPAGSCVDLGRHIGAMDCLDGTRDVRRLATQRNSPARLEHDQVRSRSDRRAAARGPKSSR